MRYFSEGSCDGLLDKVSGRCIGLFFNDFFFQLVGQMFSLLQPFLLLCRQLLQRETENNNDRGGGAED